MVDAECRASDNNRRAREYALTTAGRKPMYISRVRSTSSIVATGGLDGEVRRTEVWRLIDIDFEIWNHNQDQSQKRRTAMSAPHEDEKKPHLFQAGLGNEAAMPNYFFSISSLASWAVA
jgi:hypothetical protein